MDPSELASVKDLKQALQSKRVALTGLNEKRELIQALKDEAQIDIFSVAKDDVLTRFIKSHGFSVIPCEGSRPELIQRARDVWSAVSGNSNGPSSENLTDVDSIMLFPASVLHEILGLKPSYARVPTKDLKVAFQTTIRKVHPDKNRAQGAKQAAARVNEVYEKLKNGAVADRIPAATSSRSSSEPSFARRTDFGGHPWGANYGRYGKHSYKHEDEEDDDDEEEAFLSRERREQAKREAQRAKKEEERRKKEEERRKRDQEQQELERRLRAQQEQERRKREEERLAQKQKQKAEAEQRVLEAHRAQMEADALRKLREREEERKKVFTSQPQEAPPFIFGQKPGSFVHPVRHSSAPFTGGAPPDDASRPSSSRPKSTSKSNRSDHTASLKKETSFFKREFPHERPKETPFHFSSQTGNNNPIGKGDQANATNGFSSNREGNFWGFNSTGTTAEAWKGFQFGEKTPKESVFGSPSAFETGSSSERESPFVFGTSSSAAKEPSPFVFGTSSSAAKEPLPFVFGTSSSAVKEPLPFVFGTSSSAVKEPSSFVFGASFSNQDLGAASKNGVSPGGMSVDGGKDASTPSFVFGAPNRPTPKKSSKPMFVFGSSSSSPSATPSPDFVFGSSSWTKKDEDKNVWFKFVESAFGSPSGLKKDTPIFLFKFDEHASKQQGGTPVSSSFVFGSKEDAAPEAMNWDDLPPLPPSSSDSSEASSQADEDEGAEFYAKTKSSQAALPRKTIHSKLRARKGRVARLRGVQVSFKSMNLNPADVDNDL